MHVFNPFYSQSPILILYFCSFVSAPLPNLTSDDIDSALAPASTQGKSPIFFIFKVMTFDPVRLQKLGGWSIRTRTQEGREFISHLKIRLFFLSCRFYLLPNLKRLSRETFSLKSIVLLMYNRLLIQGFLVLFFSASYHAPSPPVFDSRQHPVITSNPSVVRSTESLQARFSGNGEFIVSFYSTSRFCSLSLQVVVFIGTLIKFSTSLTL